MTSGAHSAISRRTLSSLRRTELMFQVTRRIITAHPEVLGWDQDRKGIPQNIGARSGGKTGRLHVRSVWGKLDPQGRRVRSKEGLLPSPLPKPADGVRQKESKAAFRACPEGKIACGVPELAWMRSGRADGDRGARLGRLAC